MAKAEQKSPIDAPMDVSSIQQVAMMPPHEYKGIMQAKVSMEAEKIHFEETVPGGCYYVDGQWVNANGERVQAPSTMKAPPAPQSPVVKQAQPLALANEQPQMPTVQPGEPGYVAPKPTPQTDEEPAEPSAEPNTPPANGS